MYVRLRLYVHMFVLVYVSTYELLNMCDYGFVPVYKFVCMNVCMCAGIYVCVYILMYECVDVCFIYM